MDSQRRVCSLITKCDKKSKIIDDRDCCGRRPRGDNEHRDGRHHKAERSEAIQLSLRPGLSPPCEESATVLHVSAKIAPKSKAVYRIPHSENRRPKSEGPKGGEGPRPTSCGALVCARRR